MRLGALQLPLRRGRRIRNNAEKSFSRTFSGAAVFLLIRSASPTPRHAAGAKKAFPWGKVARSAGRGPFLRLSVRDVILSEAKDLRRNDAPCRWIGAKILRLRLRMTTLVVFSYKTSKTARRAATRSHPQIFIPSRGTAAAPRCKRRTCCGRTTPPHIHRARRA